MNVSFGCHWNLGIKTVLWWWNFKQFHDMWEPVNFYYIGIQSHLALRFQSLNPEQVRSDCVERARYPINSHRRIMCVRSLRWLFGARTQHSKGRGGSYCRVDPRALHNSPNQSWKLRDQQWAVHCQPQIPPRSALIMALLSFSHTHRILISERVLADFNSSPPPTLQPPVAESHKRNTASFTSPHTGFFDPLFRFWLAINTTLKLAFK